MNILLASCVSCFVGCNGGADDGQSMHTLSCNPDTGEVRIVQSVRDVSGTTYFQLNHSRNALYTMIKDGAKSALVVYPVENGKLGSPVRLVTLPCEAPCHIAISPDEKEIAFASYVSATAGTFSLESKRLRATILSNEGIGPREDRQKKAYAHCAFYTPDGKNLGIVNLGCDRIHFFSPSNDGLREKKEMMIKTDPGDGPRHALFSRDGRFLFVVNELSSSVASYSFDGSKFTRISKVSIVPDGTDPKSTKAAAIKLSSDGKILMASNRGIDSIAFCKVNENGSLELKNRVNLNGKFPRDFELMPGEKMMIVGHKMSDEIQVYSFDRLNYSLTPIGNALKCWKPLCFKFQ